jgi:hypothetical protein
VQNHFVEERLFKAAIGEAGNRCPLGPGLKPAFFFAKKLRGH